MSNWKAGGLYYADPLSAIPMNVLTIDDDVLKAN